MFIHSLREQYLRGIAFLLSYMKKLIFLSFSFFSSFFLQAQAPSFPGSWQGDWKGELQWFSNADSLPKKVSMELRIHPADSAGCYTWRLIYGSAASDNRPYLLKPVNPSSGHWVIDELDGIMLDQYYFANRLSGSFTVQQSTIVNHYWIEDNRMYVEFITLSATPVRTSGGRDDTPSVTSYAVKSYQKAVLKRIN